MKTDAKAEATKSDGQVAHETFHAKLEELGFKSSGGWEPLAVARKAAWEAASKAVVERATSKVCFPHSFDPPYMRAAWAKMSDGNWWMKPFDDTKKKNENDMQEKMTALHNELQRLRGQLEQTQRELSNARVHRDEAQGELTETKALCKKQQADVDSHRNDSTRARENLNAITREAKRLEVERDEARQGQHKAEKMAGDLLVVIDSVVAEREGQPAMFDVQRSMRHPGRVELNVRRLPWSNPMYDVIDFVIPCVNLRVSP